MELRIVLAAMWEYWIALNRWPRKLIWWTEAIVHTLKLYILRYMNYTIKILLNSTIFFLFNLFFIHIIFIIIWKFLNIHHLSIFFLLNNSKWYIIKFYCIFIVNCYIDDDMIWKDFRSVFRGSTDQRYDPISKDFDIFLICNSRVAVMRGQVVTEQGIGIVGIRVSVDRDPRFGFTLTRADGWWVIDFMILLYIVLNMIREE